MKRILEMLNKIDSVASTNEKKILIQKYLQDSLFTRIAKMALDCGVCYNFTDVYEISPDITSFTPTDLLDKLSQFSEKRGITNNEIKEFSKMICDKETAEVIRRIIRRDLRCGAGPALFGEVIKQTPYQRYKSFKYLDGIDFNDNVVAQLKCDGLFCYINTLDYSMISRQGNVFSLGEEFKDILTNSWLKTNRVYMGELLVIGDNGKFLPRKESNGIINSFISGCGDLSLVHKVRYVTWGYVSTDEFSKGKSNNTYIDTLNSMYVDFYEDRSKAVKISASSRVNSVEEAIAFYKNSRTLGEEGAMIKNATRLKWKNEKSGSKYGVKLKPFAEAEFRIVDAYYGKDGKKNELLLGGIVVESEDKKIKTKVGMGFSEAERLLGVSWWKEKIGEVVTIKFCGIVTDKSSRDTYCLEHSSFVELRSNEKSTADTFEYCEEVLQNA